MKKNLTATMALIAAATAVFGMTASADDTKTAEIVLEAENAPYTYEDDNGEPAGYGAHWTRAQIIDATKGMKFHQKVNDWDKYVAFNAMYADLSAKMTDEEIIKAAYLFYFCDADWQPEDDNCTKIWDYTAMHANM